MLSEAEFTHHMVAQLSPLPIEITSPEPLVIELHYGEGEPVLSVPLKEVYRQYLSDPDQLAQLLAPYLTEINWSVQPPKFSAQDIFRKTLPIMKDVMREPIAGMEGGNTQPKGPPCYQELIKRPDEEIVVQFVIEANGCPVELHRGDVVGCFPEPAQIAGIAMQNLGRRALDSGLTTKSFPVKNFQTEILEVGFRSSGLDDYVASLVNIPDVMRVLETRLEAADGLIASVPARDRLFLSTRVDELAVCEMGLLSRHMKQEAEKPVCSLVWRFKSGRLEGLQSITLEEEP